MPIRKYSFKEKVAANILERPLYEFILRMPSAAKRFDLSWVDLHNRYERIIRDPNGPGVACDWEWTRPLYLCDMYPEYGKKLMNTVFAEWPIVFDSEIEAKSKVPPVISFVICHMGKQREANLQMTIRSILAQENVSIECIVSEQGDKSVLTRLPEQVKHICTPPKEPGAPFSRSGTLNEGSKIASGEILVLHDNDICVPTCYAHEILTLLNSGYEAASLHRFTFGLSALATDSLFNANKLSFALSPERVIENSRGETIAIKKEAFLKIGGFDENFSGWGGEDNEFYDRCKALKLQKYGHLPVLHLWHAPQHDKAAINQNTGYLEKRMSLPREERIKELRHINFGS